MRSSIAALLLLFPLALALAGACTTEEGTTPDCSANVSEDGITPADDGCQQFAVCDKNADGTADPPAECCGGKEDCELILCLYGFGVRDDSNPDTDRCLNHGQGGNSGTGGTGGTGGSGTGGTGG